MSEHTPGPWKVFTTADGRHILGVGDKRAGGITDSGDVATNDLGLWRSGKERLANARLIAAAPDLLKALRKLAGNAGALRAFEDDIRAVTGHTNWHCLVDAIAEADAAIAKATPTPTGAGGEEGR